MALNKLMPEHGPARWRYGVVSRFRFNASRCRTEAARMSDPEERAYSENLAQLWEQLAEAAEFRKEFSQ